MRFRRNWPGSRAGSSGLPRPCRCLFPCRCRSRRRSPWRYRDAVDCTDGSSRFAKGGCVGGAKKSRPHPQPCRRAVYADGAQVVVAHSRRGAEGGARRGPRFRLPAAQPVRPFRKQSQSPAVPRRLAGQQPKVVAAAPAPAAPTAKPAVPTAVPAAPKVIGAPKAVPAAPKAVPIRQISGPSRGPYRLRNRPTRARSRGHRAPSTVGSHEPTRCGAFDSLVK